MEKSEIKNRCRELKTVEDLAVLLNDIKKDEFAISQYPITRKQLLYYSSSKNVPNRYRTFEIKKKSGGVRVINAPKYKLGLLLYVINIMLKAVYTPGESAMGFTEGRSIVDNARMHVGHYYVYNIDLENFFSSIPQARVWARLQCPPFNYSMEVASVLAGLCCNINAEGTMNVLPQGAATSPLLTNAICDKLDRKMRGVAKHFGLHYSRYADDMTFSGMKNIFYEDDKFVKEIKQIITDQGFKINVNKTRLLRNGQRQEVTGLVVNSKVNVTRKYIRDIRCVLHRWETQGYKKAYSYFYPLYKKEKGYIKKGEPIMENVIGGKLNFLRMVKGDNNPAYLKLKKRFDNLQQVVYIDKETDKNENYVYVQPYTIVDFEKAFNTKVVLERTSNGKLIGKCILAKKEKFLSISQSTQKLLNSNLNVVDFIEDKIESPLLKDCFVTLCRQKGKNFWMISKFEPKRSLCLSLQNVKVDVDLLFKVWDKLGIDAAAECFDDKVKGGDKLELWSTDEYIKKRYAINKRNNSEPSSQDKKADKKGLNPGIDVIPNPKEEEKPIEDPLGGLDPDTISKIFDDLTDFHSIHGRTQN